MQLATLVALCLLTAVPSTAVCEEPDEPRGYWQKQLDIAESNRRYWQSQQPAQGVYGGFWDTLFTIVGGLVLLVSFYAVLRRKWKHNRGICPKCGRDWQYVGSEESIGLSSQKDCYRCDCGETLEVYRTLGERR